MYSRLDLLPSNKLDKYMLTFIIPFFIILSVLLWFDYTEGIFLVIMSIIFLVGEIYFAMMLEKYQRRTAFFVDIVTVLFVLSQRFI